MEQNAADMADPYRDLADPESLLRYVADNKACAHMLLRVGWAESNLQYRTQNAAAGADEKQDNSIEAPIVTDR